MLKKLFGMDLALYVPCSCVTQSERCMYDKNSGLYLNCIVSVDCRTSEICGLTFMGDLCA